MVTHVSAEVTVTEAAQYKEVNPQTIRRWIKAGILPAERVGPRLLRIKVSDLDRIGAEVKPPDPIRQAALRVVEQAPELTPEQLAGICNLLRGVA